MPEIHPTAIIDEQVSLADDVTIGPFASPATRPDFYFKQAQPNRGHRALAELVRRDQMLCIITQNVDGLHQASGVDDEAVWNFVPRARKKLFSYIEITFFLNNRYISNHLQIWMDPPGTFFCQITCRCSF